MFNLKKLLHINNNKIVEIYNKSVRENGDDEQGLVRTDGQKQNKQIMNFEIFKRSLMRLMAAFSEEKMAKITD